MPSERVILDPVEVALPDRAELNLHAGAFQVREEGVDWGTAEIDAFMAQQQVGEAMIDYRLPNRIITIPLTLGASGDFEAARLLLQAKVSRINEEGGWLKRELPSGSFGFFDLVKATLKYGGSSWQAREGGFDPDAELVLEALPDFYGDRINLTVHQGTTDLAWTEQIEGNLPGRVDLEVNEESAKNQIGLMWHFRCRDYDSANTAKWAYEAEALTPLGEALVAFISGGSGSNAILHSNIVREWTPVLSTDLAGGTPLTHTGIYDVWARVRKFSETIYLRLLWDVGDVIAPQVNPQVTVPGREAFYLVHLGQVNLQKVGVGPHRWRGYIQARTAINDGAGVHIDKLYFLNAEDGSGILQGSPVSPGVGVAGYVGRDGFAQSKGALNGKAFPGGLGNWKTEGEGSDYEVNGGGSTTGAVTRSSSLDETTRSAISPIAMQPVLCARMSFLWSTLPPDWAGGTVKNVQSGLSVGTANISAFYSTEYGTGTLTFCGRSTPYPWQPGIFYTLTMLASVQGQFACGWLTEGFGEASGEPQFVANTSVLETFGPRFFDGSYMTVGGITRTYDNFAVWVPELDAVLFAGRNARLMSDRLLRTDAAGVAYGPIGYQNSDLPRIPVSGPEARAVEIALKASRGDFGLLPDGGLDKIAAQLSYRPCWSFVPES